MNTSTSTTKAFWFALGRMACFSAREYAVALLPQVFRLGLTFVPGLLMRDLFNRLSQDAALDWNLLTLIAAVVGIALARVVALIGAVGLESAAALRSGALIRTNLFEQLLTRADATTLPLGSGELVNRIRTDGRMLPLVMVRAELVFGSLVTGLVALVAMFSINATYAWVALLPVGVCVLAVNLINRLRDPILRDERAADGQVSAFLGEAFAAVQAIQMAGAESRATRHLRQLNATRQHAAIRSRVVEAWVWMFIDGFEQVGAALVLLLAATELRLGHFTIGDYALFTYAAPAVISSAFYVGALISDYKNARVAFDRMAAVVESDPAEALAREQPVLFGLGRGSAPSPEPDPAAVQNHHAPLRTLAAHGLTKRYPSTGRGIESAQVHIRAGTLTVITGRIGAGKTTLLRALFGLIPVDAGEVLWNGECLSSAMPTRVAYTPQTPHLFSETLQENIELGEPLVDGQRLGAALRMAVLDADVAHLEHGLQTVVGPRGVKLSGGQLARAAAARALVRRPDLLVFDDLSSALDVETEWHLWAGLVAEKQTIVAVSNRRATLQLADHIIMMADGRVVAQGPLDAVLTGSAAFREIWEAH